MEILSKLKELSYVELKIDKSILSVVFHDNQCVG